MASADTHTFNSERAAGRVARKACGTLHVVRVRNLTAVLIEGRRVGDDISIDLTIES
jgi:hypothetical protein